MGNPFEAFGKLLGNTLDDFWKPCGNFVGRILKTFWSHLGHPRPKAADRKKERKWRGIRKAWFAGGSQWMHRLGASRLSGTASTFDAVASRRTTMSSAFLTRSTAFSWHARGNVRDPPIQKPECEGCCSQGSRRQVGDCNGRHRRYGKSKGRVSACGPQASVGSSPRGSRELSSEKVRVFLGESAVSIGRFAFETCHSVGEHRGFRANTSVGKVEGDLFATFGVPVAVPSRIVSDFQF